MPATLQTPLSLLDRLRQPADDSSWQRLGQLYDPLIRRWLNNAGLEPADRDDLAQDIMVVLVRELPTFQHSGQPGAFRAWLRAIAMNRLRNFWRARRARPEQANGEALDAIEDRADALGRLVDAEHNQLVARRLLELMEPEFAPHTWHAFRRQVVDGRSAAETADELGVTPNAVLIAKSRVLRRLRQEARDLLD